MISKFNGRETRTAIYFAEIMCMRKAKKDKKFLPANFWNLPSWAEFYKGQIIAANNLLKYFPAELIDKALETKECNWTYSLRYSGIIPAIKRFQAEEKLKEIAKEKPIQVDETNVNKKPVVQSKKTSRSLLEDLE